MMRAKPFVLEGKQQIEKARIDVGDRRRQTPAAFAGGVGPQQPAVAIDDPGRELRSLPSGAGPSDSDPACASAAPTAATTQTISDSDSDREARSWYVVISRP